MIYRFVKNTVFLILISLLSCSGSSKSPKPDFKIQYHTDNQSHIKTSILVGANQFSQYLHLLKDKNIGITGNQTSVVFKENGYTHLVDSLLSLGVRVTKVYSPEHGFRGKASAGEEIRDGIDAKTGLPIISLYGKNKKPSSEDLKDIDLMIFDIQDVGVRFYTYISTLHYVMEACAENNIPLLILDRPNPNGHYTDGPVLQKEFSGFVGMHPIPVVHGMSIGEYAQMINGEKWLTNGIQANMTIIPVKNYSKEMSYSLPIKPSPNLPNDKAINLYPSLCFFEGTNVNAGRGTDWQFQVFGSPELDPNYFNFSYTPVSKEGAQNPKHEGKKCYGKDLRFSGHLNQLDLTWLMEAYQHTSDKNTFFNSFFEKLTGTTELRKQIETGKSQEEIRDSWQEDLENYNAMRKRYLLYDSW